MSHKDTPISPEVSPLVLVHPPNLPLRPYLDDIWDVLTGFDGDIGSIGTDITAIEGDITNIEGDITTLTDAIAAIDMGTEYTEGDVVPIPDGKVILWKDVGDILTSISAAKPLPVNVISGSITIGTVEITNDAGNPIPVNATDLDIRNLTATDVVTAELSAVDNAVLDAIAASVAAIDTDTSTIITSVQLLDDAIYTDGSGTVTKGIAVLGQDGTNPQAIKTDASGELQIDVLSIAAGDTVIGRIKLTDGADVADILDLTNSNPLTVAIVDANGDQITSFGGGTQYTEDAAAAANPVGTVPILIRADTPAGLVTTDGDNVGQRGTNYGAAYVQIVSSTGSFIDSFGGGTQYTEGDTDATITGTAMLMEGAANALVVAQGTAADGLLVNLGTNNDVTITGDALTTLQLIDDPIIVDDAAFTPATSKVMMVGFEYDDTGTDSVDEGDGGAARMSANRNVYTQIRDAAGNERGVNVNASNQLSVSVDAITATDATKTVGTSVMALQTVSASSVAISSVVDTANKLGATIFIHFGRESVTAAGAGVNIRIEGSSRSSLNGHWYPLATFTTGFAACETEPLTATEPAGETVIAVASTTNLTAGDLIFIFNTTIGSSEWHRIKSISGGASVTIEDGLLFEQTAAASDIFDGAEMFVAQLDLTSISRLRVVADGSLFTQAFAIEVDMITFDSIG